MTFLAVVGAVAITAALIYVTLGNIAVYLWGDYGLIDTTKWNWKDLLPWWVLNLALLVLWWFVVGVHITIGFG